MNALRIGFVAAIAATPGLAGPAARGVANLRAGRCTRRDRRALP